MKIGVIIVFHNYERHLDKAFFIKYAQQLTALNFCLVNNESKDNTYEILKEIKEECENVSVLNIKKFKSDVSAVRAGARFMFNANNYRHLGYINTNLINLQKNSLVDILKVLNENLNAIIEFDLKLRQKRDVRQTLFQKLFSITESLKKLQTEDELL